MRYMPDPFRASSAVDAFGWQFLKFCGRKVESRKRLKLGLTGALSTARFTGAHYGRHHRN